MGKEADSPSVLPSALERAANPCDPQHETLDDQDAVEPREIAGWGAAIHETNTCARTLARSLEQLGVREAFVVVGGGIAHLAAGFQGTNVRLRHFRHEAGAAFAAHEASVATGRPVVVCVTTGPGLYNALTGLAAARADGGHVLVLSGATAPALRGRGAVQETGPDTLPTELFVAGPLFHWARLFASAAELPTALTQIATGLQRPGGFLAHLALPTNVQCEPAPVEGIVPRVEVANAAPWVDAVDTVLSLLGQGRWGLWAGYGATRASTEIAELVRRTGCGVVCTPRAKGVFSERDPHFVGVSGAGAHETVERYVREFAIRRWLVLGTRLGEVSSFFAPGLVPPEGFVQVDLTADAFGTAFLGAPVVGVVSEVGRFLESLLDRMPEDFRRQSPHGISLPPAPSVELRDAGPVRARALFQEVQRVFVDGSDATVMAESGNSFAWANHLLRFDRPGRYRTSAAFGSMGHFVTGVVGAAIARNAKAVVLTGDGAMLMNNEVNTAVQYRAPAVWIVLNDARFGLTEDGLEALGIAPIETQMPRTDFARFAESQGALGVSVRRERELGPAFALALSHRGPVVVDVHIACDEVVPLLAQRVASIRGVAKQATPNAKGGDA
ncbi:MAG: thiamine pyrophosphate-binding protein [Myxococcales bacterium]|nr:thiamine pyrophosphate-binding protein [Myxococcales bacterium]